MYAAGGFSLSRSLISVPTIVFFPAYSLYFFAGRYAPLGALLHPAPPTGTASSAKSATNSTACEFCPPDPPDSPNAPASPALLRGPIEINAECPGAGSGVDPQGGVYSRQAEIFRIRRCLMFQHARAGEELSMAFSMAAGVRPVRRSTSAPYRLCWRD